MNSNVDNHDPMDAEYEADFKRTMVSGLVMNNHEGTSQQVKDGHKIVLHRRAEFFYKRTGRRLEIHEDLIIDDSVMLKWGVGHVHTLEELKALWTNDPSKIDVIGAIKFYGSFHYDLETLLRMPDRVDEQWKNDTKIKLSVCANEYELRTGHALKIPSQFQ
jgi:hypothetical protein